ncbi:MAG: cell envelope biogenesis protein TolA [Faecalibacterium sp.]
MATNKKEQEELYFLAAQQVEPSAGQNAYSTAGLNSRSDVEQALANAQYQQSQAVTDAADELKQWQAQRPDSYQSSYRDSIEELLGKLMSRNSFQYSYTQDPLYRQYAENYIQNAHNASADAAALASALTGGYGSSYAVSAAQQAYQQQIGALNNAIPTLYSLALDTYNSGGDQLVDQLDQISARERDEQELYNQELEDYYRQLEQKGDAYNSLFVQDYSQYQDYLSRLDALYNYYSSREQAAAAQSQQTFNNIITVLGVLGDVAQLVLSGTTGLGSLVGGLLNTGYNIYADNRQYEAERADAAWAQSMQEQQRQDTLAQQQYKNDAAEREYQAELAQQKFDNNIASQKLQLAKDEWELKQSQAASAAATANAKAASASSNASDGNLLVNNIVVPYTAARLRSQGKSDSEIRSALLADGYNSTQIRRILEQLNS